MAVPFKRARPQHTRRAIRGDDVGEDERDDVGDDDDDDDDDDAKNDAKEDVDPTLRECEEE